MTAETITGLRRYPWEGIYENTIKAVDTKGQRLFAQNEQKFLSQFPKGTEFILNRDADKSGILTDPKAFVEWYRNKFKPLYVPASDYLKQLQLLGIKEEQISEFAVSTCRAMVIDFDKRQYKGSEYAYVITPPLINEEAVGDVLSGFWRSVGRSWTSLHMCAAERIEKYYVPEIAAQLYGDLTKSQFTKDMVLVSRALALCEEGDTYLSKQGFRTRFLERTGFSSTPRISAADYASRVCTPTFVLPRNARALEVTPTEKLMRSVYRASNDYQTGITKQALQLLVQT